MTTGPSSHAILGGLDHPYVRFRFLVHTGVGRVRAYAMFALGEPVDATTSSSWGLANAVGRS
jgi:hypothetical protein